MKLRAQNIKTRCLGLPVLSSTTVLIERAKEQGLIVVCSPQAVNMPHLLLQENKSQSQSETACPPAILSDVSEIVSKVVKLKNVVKNYQNEVKYLKSKAEEQTNVSADLRYLQKMRDEVENDRKILEDEKFLIDTDWLVLNELKVENKVKSTAMKNLEKKNEELLRMVERIKTEKHTLELEIRSQKAEFDAFQDNYKKELSNHNLKISNLEDKLKKEEELKMSLKTKLQLAIQNNNHKRKLSSPNNFQRNSKQRKVSTGSASTLELSYEEKNDRSIMLELDEEALDNDLGQSSGNPAIAADHGDYGDTGGRERETAGEETLNKNTDFTSLIEDSLSSLNYSEQSLLDVSSVNRDVEMDDSDNISGTPLKLIEAMDSFEKLISASKSNEALHGSFDDICRSLNGRTDEGMETSDKKDDGVVASSRVRLKKSAAVINSQPCQKTKFISREAVAINDIGSESNQHFEKLEYNIKELVEIILSNEKLKSEFKDRDELSRFFKFMCERFNGSIVRYINENNLPASGQIITKNVKESILNQIIFILEVKSCVTISLEKCQKESSSEIGNSGLASRMTMEFSNNLLDTTETMTNSSFPKDIKLSPDSKQWINNQVKFKIY